MMTAIEIVTTQTLSCPGCGLSHRLRVALHPDSETSHEALLGFFRRCPVSHRMVWLVVTLPRPNDGGSWLLQVGPTDDEQWEPDDIDDLLRTHDAGSERSEAVGVGSGIRQYPPRDDVFGGRRGRSPAPDLLRLVLGCPLHN